MQLTHPEGKIVISMDTEYKNHHTFQDGTEIRLERQYDNFNRRETEPVNAIVISGDGIPEGAEILVHHNVVHEVNQIHDFLPLSAEATSSSIRYFSIREEDSFVWREKGGDWKPCKNYELAMRVFKPYEGLIQGIAPKVMKDVLYVTSGALKGQIVHTLRSCDYEIVFRDTDGREARLIRFRHSEDENYIREEVICLRHDLTEKLEAGKLLVGYHPEDAKPVKKD